MSTRSIEPCRVLLVDDSPEVRRALMPVLAGWGYAVVGSLESADELVRALVSEHPDVVLLDIAMPGRSALHAVEDLRYRGSPAKVLVYSAMCDAETVRRYLTAGALAYVCKDDSAHELREGLMAARAGRRYLSTSAARSLPPDERPPETPGPADTLPQPTCP